VLTETISLMTKNDQSSCLQSGWREINGKEKSFINQFFDKRNRDRSDNDTPTPASFVYRVTPDPRGHLADLPS
jgi:hypothetical protein